LIAFRDDLQILRGLAITFVFLYHLKVHGFENGYLGVDLFFVLSGFLMALLTEKDNVLEFYNRRLRRLLPAYLATIFITSIIIAFVSIPSDANQSFDRFWFNIIGLSNIAFWFENTYFESESFKPFLHLWSLGVEMQFYLVAPFLLPFLRHKLVLTLLLVIGSLVISILFTSISPKTSFFMMPLRLWEFLVGALVAWYPLRLSSKLNQGWAETVGLAMLLGVIFLYPLKHESHNILYGHPGLAAFLVATITAFLIAFKMDNEFIIKGFLGRIMSRLGDYSYSIYLIHFPIIILFNYQEFEGTRLGYEGITSAFIIILLTFILSFLMFNFVESLRSSKKFLKIIFIAFSGLIFLGLTLPSINNWRFSDKQLRIFNAWEDRSSYRCGKIFQLLNPTEGICPLGTQDGKYKILLLGNSHADSIKTSFASSMDKNGVSSYFYVDNNPLMSKQASAKFIASDIARLNMEKVVIHYSLGFYEEESYQNELINFINLMNDQQVDVIFISPTPSYKFHVPKLLYEQSINESVQLKKQTMAEYFKNNNSFYSLIKKLNISDSNIFYSQQFLCPENDCLISINGNPVYFDASHLTITGANLLIPIFNQIAD